MSGFRSAAIKGAWWVTGARLIRIFASLITLSILSRFLSAEEFGLAGLVIFVTGLAQVIGDFGTRLSLVQKPDITPLEIDSIFWLNLGIGCAMAAGTIIFATEISTLFNAPGMEKPLMWSSSIFVLTSLQGVPASLTERKLQFNKLAIAETMGTVVGAITAVVMVLMGYRLEALISQLIIIAVVTTFAINMMAGWMPGLRFSLTAIRPMLNFGFWASLAGLIGFVGMNAERPILATTLSTAALGYFTLAQQIVQTPIRTIVQVVRKLTMPVFARMQDDDERARRAYLNVCHALMVVMSPICFGLIAVAGDFTRLFLGAGKEAVAPLIVILSARALITTLSDINGSILTSWGKMRFQFWWVMFSTTMAFSVIWIAAPYGLETAIWARLGLTMVMSPLYALPVLTRLGLLNGALLRTVAPPVLSGAVMCLVVRAFDRWHPFDGVIGLLLAIALGAIVYAAMQFVLDRGRSRELANAMINRRAKHAA